MKDFMIIIWSLLELDKVSDLYVQLSHRVRSVDMKLQQDLFLT